MEKFLKILKYVFPKKLIEQFPKQLIKGNF